MIKAEELRIGNWISELVEYWDDTPPKKRFIQFDFNDFNSDFDLNDLLKNYEPIELTSEILEKCGFIVKDDNPKKKQWYEGDVLVDICGFQFSNSYSSNSNGGFYSYDLNQGKTIIKYLHQLQNLYYFLCGQELQITFDKVEVTEVEENKYSLDNISDEEYEKYLEWKKSNGYE